MVANDHVLLLLHYLLTYITEMIVTIIIYYIYIQQDNAAVGEWINTHTYVNDKSLKNIRNK